MHQKWVLIEKRLRVLLCRFQRDFDENEVDPYHGQQEKAAEPEPMDLPEDLALGDDEEGGDEEEGECEGSPSTEKCRWSPEEHLCLSFFFD